MRGPRDQPTHVRTFFCCVADSPRSAGYWLRKLFFVRETLDAAGEGDFLLYIHAEHTINAWGRRRFAEYLLMDSKSGALSTAEEWTDYRYNSGRMLETFGVLAHTRVLPRRPPLLGGHAARRTALERSSCLTRRCASCTAAVGTYRTAPATTRFRRASAATAKT